MFLFKTLNEYKINRKQKSGKMIADFHGGVHPPENKSPANLHEIKRLPLVDFYSIPLSQHIGNESEIIVQAGQHVLKGEPLTVGLGNQVPIHAPTSGIIKGIVKQPSATYFSEETLAILLESDKQDKPYAYDEFNYLTAKPEEIVEQIHLKGIVGLGGAGFPTAIKLNHQQDGIEIDTLIINAAECEPFISADDRLMREHSEELIRGLDIVRKILHPKLILIGIEDNKPEAISSLESALENTRIDLIRLATKVIVIPTKYPSGGAKQLVTLLTGKEIPSGKHASDIGISMLNVGTLFAIKRAIVDREPLIERVVTLAGQNFIEPANYWVRIGTPIKSLLKQVYYDFDKHEQLPIIMGGPMMGYPINLLSSVVKTTNCLLARSSLEIGEVKKEQPCIRCGECAAVCPAQLLPQQLFWYAQGREHDKSKEYNLFDCIECGACEYVCPSHIPLVHYYKIEKQLIRKTDAEEKLAAEAKARYETKLARLEAEKIAREARHKQISTEINEKDKSAIEAAIARVKAKKTVEKQIGTLNEAPSIGGEIDNNIQASQVDERQNKVQAAIERARAKKTQLNNKDITPRSEDPLQGNIATLDEGKMLPEKMEIVDPRKLAVAAALERAKAKRTHKAAIDNAPLNSSILDDSATRNSSNLGGDFETEVPSKVEIDPRKAKVQEAIERAKAKRTINAEIVNNQLSERDELKQSEHINTQNIDDKANSDIKTAKELAIEAALARAKARKSKSTDAN
ncbi:electron transport complex subunit RsxC [Thorsellia anophelis]|uniref:Ion-translocating oxidoreductase complex subunit C n=1 Tax=Thorsellia anophelis DSM 18579 TaxID=1123402 RepID=A0A1I0CTD2_9GAMM|nr:electron transport complex subunit RsxC [Thorsellia anophelis]SET22974.1 electron transport complex protein RnfC [Thorsellia anophelis DSM 18579]